MSQTPSDLKFLASHEWIRLVDDNVVVVGGVAANKSLRKMMISEASKKSIKVHLAPLNLCTDNAAMIAYLGEIKLKFGSNYRLDFSIKPNMKLI